MKISEQIKAARKAKGITQSQLSKLTKLRQATISDIEHGSDCQLSTLKKICLSLDCNLVVTIEK